MEERYKEIIKQVKKFDARLKDEFRSKGIFNFDDVQYPGVNMLHKFIFQNGANIAYGLELKQLKRGHVASYHKHTVFIKHRIKLVNGVIHSTYDWLKEINTSHGKLHIQIAASEDKSDEAQVCAYTNHFFDRYATRTGMAPDMQSAAEMRLESINSYMLRDVTPAISKSDLAAMDIEYDVAFGCEHGLCLGVRHKNLILMKTFVSNDMLGDNQKEIVSKTVTNMFPEKVMARKQTKTKRNEPCPCGSGNKFKKCCMSSYATP